MKSSYWLLTAGLLVAGCGESPTAKAPPSNAGVFQGYVETHEVAKDTAQSVQDAMQRQERAIEQQRQ